MSTPFYVYGGNAPPASFTANNGTGNNNLLILTAIALPACAISAIGLMMLNNSASTMHVKLALYNSSKNLVAGSTGTITLSSNISTMTWEEAAISVSVAAGAYYIGCNCDNTNISMAGSSVATNPVNGWYTSETYSSFPPSTLPSVSDGGAMAFGVKIAVPNDYSTSFPLTENPVSESGNWTNAVAGSTNLATSGGFCYGINNPPSNTNDAVATLANGLWSVPQFVQAQVSIPGATYGTDWPEVELHLIMTNTSTNIYGYEIAFSVGQGASSYMTIVRWNGLTASPGFNVLLDLTNNAEYGVVDGDVITAWIDSTNTIYAAKNGVQIGSVQDTGTGGYGPFTSGKPGLGFNYAPTSGSGTGAHNAYGVSSYLAVSAASIYSRRGFGPKISDRQMIGW
jgi:hypothetical protein